MIGRRYKSESYRRFVASFPCFGCGLENHSQACHRNGGGMGTKHSDLETFPLCADRLGVRGCHYKFDNLIGITREERRALEDSYVASMQEIARFHDRPELLTIKEE